MNFIRAFGLAIFLMLAAPLHGRQSLDFTAQETACINERLLLDVVDGPEAQIEWDFCGNQLEGTYSSLYRGTIGSQLTNIKVIQDNGHWYGFAVTRTNQLFRLDLGNNPSNAPASIVSLGNPGNSIFSPEGIDIIKENNTWYGLITNLGNEITRLNWGGSLVNSPTGERLNLNAYNKLNAPIEIEILHQNNQYVAVVVNSNVNQLTLINFGSSLSNIPANDDMKMSSPFPGGSGIYGVASARVCNDWDLYVIAIEKLYKVTLGGTIFNDINPEQITDITSDVPISIGAYNHVRTLVEGTDVHVFFSSYTGVQVQSIIWRAGASHAVFNDLHLPPIGYNPYGFDVYEHNGQYGLLITGFNDGAFSQVTATVPCPVNQRFSNEKNPTVFYTQAGTYEIILNASQPDGAVCASSQSIAISSAVSPVISFNFSDVKCVNTQLIFNALGNTGDVAAFAWDFGDGSTSSSQNPQHEYDHAAIFPIALSVAGLNGCSNFSLDTLQIYPEPVSVFTGPAGVVCTQTELLFENNTVDEFDGYLTFEWLVNDIVQSTERDFSTTLTETDPLNVKLRTSIPGCSSQAEEQYSTVFEGPVVSFSSTGHCEADNISFSNESMGSVSGYSWNFGDGQNSTLTNPIHVYPNPGLFTVTLTASNAAGCNNTTSKLVTIYSVPQVDFTALAPPFSCSGTPTQFNDLTPPPSDSNLSSWQWNFGDTGNPANASTQRNPQHTYATAGDYNVSLTVTSNFLCSATFQKSITVHQTPDAAFTHTALCEDGVVTFSDAASTNQAWNWQIGSSYYTTQSAQHVFSNPGNYNVMLSVTGANNCIGTAAQNVVINPRLPVNFTVVRSCINQQTEFTDVTNDATDPITGINWNFGGLGNAQTDPATFTFPETGTIDVTLTVTTQSGCEYPLTKSITIASGPLAAFTAQPNTGEAPLNVQFINTSLNANTYAWNFGEGSTSTSASPAFTYLDEGIYTIALTAADANNCVDSTRQLIEVNKPSELNAPAPNPGPGAFVVEWKTTEAAPTTLTIVDATGRQVRNFDVQANAGINRVTIDITGEQNGLYVLQIRYQNTLKTYRLIVSR